MKTRVRGSRGEEEGRGLGEEGFGIVGAEVIEVTEKRKGSS